MRRKTPPTALPLRRGAPAETGASKTMALGLHDEKFRPLPNRLRDQARVSAAT